MKVKMDFTRLFYPAIGHSIDYAGDFLMDNKPTTIRLVVDNGLSQEVKAFSDIIKTYRMTADDLSIADWRPDSIAIFKKAMELEKLDPQRPEDVATMLKRMHDSHFGIGQKNDPGS